MRLPCSATKLSSQRDEGVKRIEARMKNGSEIIPGRLIANNMERCIANKEG